jgi:hypothetical protein
MPGCQEKEHAELPAEQVAPRSDVERENDRKQWRHDLLVHVVLGYLQNLFGTGLQDFSWYNIPKRGTDIPNNHKIYQMAKLRS